jgi:hypothetical protein
MSDPPESSEQPPTSNVDAHFERAMSARPSLGPGFVRVPIHEESDVAIARNCVRHLAPQGGLAEIATSALATAVSEIAYNVLIHARVGELTVRVTDEPDRRGVDRGRTRCRPRHS